MNTHRLTRPVALGLTVFAFAAPTAAAEIPHHASPEGNPVAGPDDKAAAMIEARRDLRSPDTRDHADGRGTFNAPEVTVVKVTEPSPVSGGVDWADAGIGAGAAFGLSLLALGSTLAVVRRRHGVVRPQEATTA
jgi:hypothetical protein